MGGRFLHVVLMPEDGGSVRNFRITARALQLSIVGLAALVLALGTSLLLHTRTIRDAQNLVLLREENAALRERLDEFERTTDRLESVVGVLEKREREARLLAGLDPIDEDTRSLGIGGPALAGEPDAAIRSKGLRGDIQRQEIRLASLERKAEFERKSYDEILGVLEQNRERLACTPTICPVRSGYTLSSGFGSRQDPFTGRWGRHNGLDLLASPGTPVLASADGVVAFVGHNGDYGLTVQIDHGYGFQTSYSHLSSACVEGGAAIKRGDKIGGVGSSGRTTGPHLHYEVVHNGTPVDPQKFILTLQAIVD